MPTDPLHLRPDLSMIVIQQSPPFPLFQRTVSNMTTQTMSSKTILKWICLLVAIGSFSNLIVPTAAAQGKILRIGMIGLDTSHAPAFAKLWNNPEATGLLAEQQIVVAFPGGSPDIESSHKRVPQYTKDLQALGVKMVDSLDELISQVDAVVITSLDGRRHLEQAIPVFRAGKPLYIDKPLAGSLVDAIAIQKIAAKHNGKWFSSSSLRFSPAIWKYRIDPELKNQVRGAIAWSPCSIEATHPDLYWYGVHGCESLYTAMGQGCTQVTRVSTKGTDSAIGVWDSGRIGEFRGLREGKTDYGLVVFGDSKIEVGGKYEGYAPLVDEIAKSFAGGPVPIASDETIEMFAFMEAADESKRRGGSPVMIADVMAKATQAATKLVAAKTEINNAPKKIVLIAGKPSHPARMHEFNAGVQLLSKCLKDVPGVKTGFVLNGWPKDESILENADAIVFYMDGGKGHEAVQEEGQRLKKIEQWVKKGVGIGCMHFGVEIVPDQAGKEFKRWIGGHYENMFSCNPIWEPQFSQFPNHPVARGVKPFQAKDEWYFNMRFVSDSPGNVPADFDGSKFVPILIASPSDDVRDGPYVYPKGPYAHIESNKGRAEAMMWSIERPDGGRGFGFTGGHFHDNWGNDNYRKVVLNALLWTAHAEVPQNGVDSKVTAEELEANLDPKKK